jgi:hypothetical protein
MFECECLFGFIRTLVLSETIAPYIKPELQIEREFEGWRKVLVFFRR